MRRWFDYVDDGRSPIAEQLAFPWFGDAAAIRCGLVSSNISCRLVVDQGTYYLRCNFEGERSRTDYEAEVAFVQHLAGAGVPFARPLRSRQERWVESVRTEIGTLHAVLFEEAPGVQLDLTEVSIEQLTTWGETVATVHDASESFMPKGRPSWRDHLRFATRTLPPAEEAAHRELAIVENAMGAVPSGHALIHFDIEADNMYWLGGRPTLYDFDDCASYPLAVDVVFALRDLYQDDISRIDFQDVSFRAFVDGYRSLRPLPDYDLLQGPLFMRAHNLYWFARLYRARGDIPMKAEPEWVVTLRDKIQRTMDIYRDGFERHPVMDYIPSVD